MRNYAGDWTQFCIAQYEENKYAALNQNPGPMINLFETPFCQMLILWAEFEYEQYAKQYGSQVTLMGFYLMPQIT